MPSFAYMYEKDGHRKLIKREIPLDGVDQAKLEKNFLGEGGTWKGPLTEEEEHEEMREEKFVNRIREVGH